MGVETTWKKVTSISRSFSNIFETRLVTIANIIGVILAFGAEYLIEENHIFSCPCIKELAYTYGLSFIFGGFALFWLLGLIVYAQTWKACHGCFHVTCSRSVCCIYCNSSITACIKTIIVPIAWVFAIVLDGDYIACMMADACTVESEDYQNFKKQSQRFGLWALCGLLAAVCLIRSCAACFNENSYLHYTFSQVYRKAEEETLFNSKSETVDGLAKEVVINFLQKKDLTENDWKAATDENQDLGVFFSPLHKLVGKEKYAEVKPEKKEATDSSNV